MDAVLGDICRRHKSHPINSQLGRCCSGPHCCWLTCFHSLGEDKKYDPVPFSPEFHEDLCSANPNNQHIQKQRWETKYLQPLTGLVIVDFSNWQLRTIFHSCYPHQKPLFFFFFSFSQPVYFSGRLFPLSISFIPVTIHRASKSLPCKEFLPFNNLSIFSILYCPHYCESAKDKILKQQHISEYYLVSAHKSLCLFFLIKLYPIVACWFSCRFLVNLIKYKPTITIVQSKIVMRNLNGVLEKCCKAVKNWGCIRVEVYFIKEHICGIIFLDQQQ